MVDLGDMDTASHDFLISIYANFSLIISTLFFFVENNLVILCNC